MSPVTTVIPTVTTEDAAPTVAPHRISRDAAHTTVSAPFTPTHDGNIVPGPSLLPTDGRVPPSELRPGSNTRPGNRAARRPASGYPTLYPDTGIVPDQGALVPQDGYAPLFPGFTPGASAIPAGGPFNPFRPLVGFVVREGGADPSTGKAIKFAGIRAGAAPCSTRRVASRQDYSSASGTPVPLTFTFADADDGGADGARTINVYVQLEGQGTS